MLINVEYKIENIINGADCITAENMRDFQWRKSIPHQIYARITNAFIF